MFYPFTHALCVAPAGSGKSISIALPSKLHGYRISDEANKSEAASVVVTDIKGEIAAMTARMSETQHKHKVFISTLMNCLATPIAASTRYKW